MGNSEWQATGGAGERPVGVGGYHSEWVTANGKQLVVLESDRWALEGITANGEQRMKGKRWQLCMGVLCVEQ
jgi:hypothetical protein